MTSKNVDAALWAAMTSAAARAKHEGMPEEVQGRLKEMVQQHPDAVRKQVLEGTGIDLAKYGQQRSKEELLSSHNNALHRLKSEILRKCYQLNVSCARDVKSAADFPAPPPLSECTPIHICSLQLGVTHKGRVLRGTLLPEKPVVYTAAQELLEDENGDAVRVSLYNFIPEFETGMEKQLYAEKILRRGLPIAIIEPYYKVFADGSQGVRVDNPAEVVFLDSISPTSAKEWQAEAKKHFVGNQYEEALRCYAEALRIVRGGSNSSSSSSSSEGKPNAGATGGGAKGGNEPGLLVSLLLNISACTVQLGNPAAALQYAAAASAIDPNAPKPYYRAALALDAVGGHAGAAEWFMLESARLSAGALLGCKKQNAATDAASKVAAQLLPQLNHHKAQASSGSMTQPQAAALMQQHLSRTPAAGSKFQIQALRVIASAQGEPHPSLAWGKDTSAGSASNRADVAGQGRDSSQDGTSGGKAGGMSVQDGGAASAGATQHAQSAEAAAQKKKEEGNQLYRTKEWRRAALLYDQALAKLAVYPALLLSNSAACLLNLSNNQQAAQAAAAATLLDPMNMKAAYRCISALLGLEWLNEAGSACTQALRMHPEDASLQGLQQRVSSAAAATKATSAAKATPTAAQGKQQAQPSRGGEEISEREMHKRKQKNVASAQSMAVMNDMMMMMPAALQARKSKQMGMDVGVDTRIPPFHQEFMKSGALPALCDKDACFDHIWYAYECARGMFTHQVTMFSPKISMDLIMSPENMMQRLQVLSEDRIKWLMDAPMGNVSFFLRPPYTPKKVHSFGNVPAKMGRPCLQPGTTHVAVGFLDLGTLCAACSAWNIPEQQEKQHCQPPVLRWVGFDSSAGCVAQSLVVAQMLKMGAQIDHILQVWISAAWSRATLAAFRAALTALLTTTETASRSPSKHTWEQALPLPVQQVLRHWQLHDVSLQESRKSWLDNSDMTDTYVANFVRKEHRTAMWVYLLSGQVLHADVGSVTMFADPDPEVDRSMSESFLQTLPFEELHHCMEERGLDPVQAGVEILRARLAQLAQAVRLGQVDIQVRLGAVVAEDKPLLKHIAALRPDTMSWSNVPDYITPPSRFHTLAAACSSPSTIHYMHSMNWPGSVKGACHMDFQVEDLQGAPEVLKRLLAISKKDIQRKYKELGIKYLLCPPVDNPRNTVDFQLFLRHYKDWVRAFFSEGRQQGLRDVEKQVSVDPPEYNILSRSNSTIGITFTYSRDEAVLMKLAKLS